MAHTELFSYRYRLRVGGNTLSNKKFFVGRIVMIQSAIHFPDLGKCYTYSERLRTTHRKFSTGVWSQSLRQISHKMIEYSEVWQSSRDLNLKNPLESHFSFNKKCFVSHTILIQNMLHFSDPVECFTYSERMRTTHRKFSTGFWSQILCQKLTQNDRIFWSVAKLQRLAF